MTNLRVLQILEVHLEGVQPLQTHVVQDRQSTSGADQVEVLTSTTGFGDRRANVVHQVCPREAIRQVDNDVRTRQVQVCSTDLIHGVAQVLLGSVVE